MSTKSKEKTLCMCREQYKFTLNEDMLIFEQKLFSKEYNYKDEVMLQDIFEIEKKKSAWGPINFIVKTKNKNYKWQLVLSKDELEELDNFYDCVIEKLENNPKEIKKKCCTCGKIFCYTLEDVSENNRKQLAAGLSALGAISSSFSGNRYDMYEQNKIANSSGNAVVDFDRCPHCGSRDITDVSNENKKDEIDVVQELKKYKELLDSGIISQEEFDKKKKELLK